MRILKKNWLALLLVLLGICSFYWGMAQGEATTVYQKAAKICLECIGIG